MPAVVWAPDGKSFAWVEQNRIWQYDVADSQKARGHYAQHAADESGGSGHGGSHRLAEPARRRAEHPMVAFGQRYAGAGKRRSFPVAHRYGRV